MTDTQLKTAIDNAPDATGDWILALPIHFRPHWSTRLFSAIGCVLASGALLGAMDARLERSLWMMALGLAMASLLAILVCRLVRNRAWHIRFFLVIFLGTIVLELMDGWSSTIAHALFNLLCLVTAGISLAVFLCDQNLKIEITADGIVSTKRFSIHARTCLAWKEIERVTADMLTVSIRQAGQSLEICEAKRRVILEGNRKRIIISTPPCRFLEERIFGDPRWVDLVIPRASAAAVKWTLGEVAMRGRVRLGPLEISREEVVVHRAIRGTKRIRIKDIHDIAIELKSIRLVTQSGPTRIALRGVPNGIYLGDIIRALSIGTKASSEPA